VIGDRSRTFFTALESRLDRVLFRRRFRPTIYACNQFIRHVGISVNGGLIKTPQAHLRIGDTVSLVPTNGKILRPGSELSVQTNADQLGRSESDFSRRRQIWRTLYWDRFCRLYYRRWGLYIIRRRLTSQLKRKVRPFTRRAFPGLPIVPSVSGTLYGFNRSTRSSSRSDLVNVLRRRLTVLGGVSAYSSSLTILNNQTVDKYTPKNLQVLRHRLKVWRALRLRASFLPRVRRDSRHNRITNSSIQGERLPSSATYIRPFRRTTERRFRANRRSKNDRRRKRRRLAPVHRLFPNYLQIDLRTLRATRIYAPSSEDVYYPFRASLAQVRTFYRSRGRQSV
jgi:ribosomal protein S4